MWKNILCLIIGALVFSVLIDRPIFAQDQNFSYLTIAISTRELALFNRKDGTVYYHDKTDGTILRIHQLNDLGKRMEMKTVNPKDNK